MIVPNKYRWEFILLVISVFVVAFSFLFQSVLTDKTSLSSRAAYFEKRINHARTEFNSLLKDSVLLDRIITGDETYKDLNYIYKKPFYTFLYRRTSSTDSLQFWSTGVVLPSDKIINTKTTESIDSLSNGYYYAICKPLKKYPGFTAICLITIKNNFFIETDYLRNTFAFDDDLDKVADLSLTPTSYPIKSLDGRPVFFLKQKSDVQTSNTNELYIILRLLGLFLIFLSAYLILCKRYAEHNILLNITLFLSALAGFRIILYLFRNILQLNHVVLFNPDVYNYNVLLPTLGDVFINSILFCWGAHFIWKRIDKIDYRIPGKISPKTWILSIISVAGFVVSAFFIINLIKSLISDSKISFDVTNFFSLNVYTAIGFLILVCLSLGFYYLSQSLFKFIFPVFNTKGFYIYLLVAIIGLLYTTFFASDDSISFYLPCLIWLLLYTFLFDKEDYLNSLLKFNVSGIIFWIFIFSISIALLMLGEIRKNELFLRKMYVEKLSTQTNPATERLINTANKYLDTDFFKNNYYRLYNQTENTRLRDSIKTQNYASYLNNYNTTLYFFDSLNNPLHNPTPLTFETLNTVVNLQSKPTDFPDVYFYETGYDKFAYITRRVIKDNKRLLGNIFIISNPKKFSGTNITPELFKQFRQWELANSSTYQYAVYYNNLLTESTKQYPFTSTLSSLQIPQKRYEIRYQNGYNELWYRPDASKVIVMVRKRETVLETITLFSYIFCSYLFLITAFYVLSIIVRFALTRKKVKRRLDFFPTIRSQIHVTLIFINVFAFVVIGFATISFFINRFYENNNERLGNTMDIMLHEIQSYPSIKSTLYKNDHVDSTQMNVLNDLVKRISGVHGLDVNIYDLSGKLRASSQPDVYNKGVLSPQISARAFYSLQKLKRIEHIQNEKVSHLTYTTIYAPIRDTAGNSYAYLSIPYFTSQQRLNQEISNFLITLIDLIAFIFLITGMLAMIITNRITRSFSLVSNKMKEMSLSKFNEYIVWNKHDEIGQLVIEYNRMVDKLRESANTLAREEREVAWREMARQVAHEIKNPLTPMKLSLQYLQRAIHDDRPNIRQLTASVSATLVEQIDHLSKIAADFSQFANINHTDKQIFDLHEIIFSLQDLYSKNPRVQFEWYPLSSEVNVVADKTQMNRLFTNLLVNGIDAVPEDTTCVLRVEEREENGEVIISITDNGIGISDELRDKIFTPNFTTKSSGTGLGLAMCKRIIEQASGAIWFETTVNKGTTFFIKLPFMPS